ncbi:MAG: S-layer family protein, partial [Stigonema ocellatum SAG 48.90 = DSM 106950]|nr:S-layer family protein [Stigonema ocellatum SAG 48.90 = DSM 106950]
STSSTGDAGNVTINTRELLAQDGAQVNASTSGAGAGGSLTVNGVNGPGSKADSVQLIGTTPDGLMSSGLFVAADPGATRGAAGDVTINTRELLVQGGARVSAVTSGAANGGRVTVDADSVKLISANKFGTIPSDLSTKSESGAQGTPGPLTINTRELLVQDGAQVNASTTGQGNGGEVMINANTLEIKGGGQILTTASNSGKAGDITVNASDRIILENANSSILANTTSSSTGDGGKITIKPQPNQLKFPDITIADGAQVAVDNQGTGKGGEISIQANTLTLDRGKLTASAIKDGGNIMLNLPNYLLLRHNSQISANTNSQTGGNIKIDTPFIVSFPSKNSINSITANATTGEGGKITINAGLFGIAPLTQQEIDSLRSQSSKPPTQSYIAAYSEKSQNLSGNVTVNSPDTDPSRTIVQLPQTVVDPVNKIAQNPCQQGTGSAFIITGRGGLPSNPNQALTSDNVRVDLLTPVSSRDAINRVSTVKPSTTSTVKQIVPAQGWVFNDKGQVVLTAYDPTNTGSQRPWRTPASCAKR